MAISQTVIDNILDRTDIVDLINQHVKLKKAGNSYTACCPFHQEKSPSFHVRRDKGYYHCFGCHASGNAIGFLMAYDRLPFVDAVTELAKQAGVEIPKEQNKPAPQYTYKKVLSTPTKKKQIHPAKVQIKEAPPKEPPQANINFTDDLNHPKTPPAHVNVPFDALPEYTAMDDWPNAPQPETSGDLHELLEQICLYYQNQLQLNYNARVYTQQRQLDVETVLFWRIGYAPSGWQHLQEAFPADIEGLKTLGLVRSSDNGQDYCLLRERIIFPIRNRKGQVVGFGGRALNNEVKPKYINSPESVVFNKSQLLYGFFESQKKSPKQWLMVEGYMDVIALYQAGVYGAVASLGTATNSNHFAFMFKYSPSLVMAFDGDSAGQNAAWRSMELALPLLNDGRELKFLPLPTEHDPDSLIKQEGLAFFEKRIQGAPPLSDFIYNQLATQADINSPEGKSQVMAKLQPIIDALPQGNYKYLLRQTIKQKLGFGWQKSAQQVAQQALNFDTLSLEEQICLMLLHYPQAVQSFNSIDFSPQPKHLVAQLIQLLSQALTDLQAAQNTLSAKALVTYCLYAWPNPTEQQKLILLLNQSFNPDMQEHIAHMLQDKNRYALKLKEHFIQLQLRQVGGKNLQSIKQLQLQLLDIQKELIYR